LKVLALEKFRRPAHSTQWRLNKPGLGHSGGFSPDAVAKRPFEKHTTPAEVAQLWGISVDMARDLFRNEPDVLALERTGSKKYVTLRIPEAVLVRVHNRFSRS